ncbi:hypothetical protein AC249_AIPGENE26428 [Exaiptasia diaphana]|nr:hypothetical protein AC249_AIPGENE26428 [Exaiptasia diaphana]
MQQSRAWIEWSQNKVPGLQHRRTHSSTRSGTVLEQKDDFKYLGSWVDKSIKDVNIRKALAWKALNDMTNIWKSTMNPVLKKRFFVATVESILLYGCESWSMTESMKLTRRTLMLEKMEEWSTSKKAQMAEVLHEDYMSSEESEVETDENGRRVFVCFNVKKLRWESKRLAVRKEKLDNAYDDINATRRTRRQPRNRSNRFISNRPCPRKCPDRARNSE